MARTKRSETLSVKQSELKDRADELLRLASEGVTVSVLDDADGLEVMRVSTNAGLPADDFIPEGMPSVEEVLSALDWLRAGAPAAHRDFKEPAVVVRVLLQLLHALPIHFPVYVAGSAERNRYYDAINQRAKGEK